MSKLSDKIEFEIRSQVLVDDVSKRIREKILQGAKVEAYKDDSAIVTVAQVYAALQQLHLLDYTQEGDFRL
jgi:hypothetical protein